MKENKVDNSIHLISQIRKKINDFLLQELKKIGLKKLVPSHGDIFAALYKHGELTMTEIAEKINRDRSTVTTLVKKLSKLGYVESKVDPEDNRSNIIFLTPKGKKFKKDFKKISFKLHEIEYQGVSEEERKVFLKVLKKINNNFS